MRSGLDMREWAVRASVEATGGEWIREPPPALPALLRRRRGGSRVGRQREGPAGSFDEEEKISQSSRGRRRPREGEGEEEEEERSHSRDDVTVEQYLTDWDPVLQRLRPYRILNSGSDAESGEEFFVLSPTHGYRRQYRPTFSERDEEAGVEDMEVDGGNAAYSNVPVEEGATLPDDDYLWEAYERDEPPEALDWSKLENCSIFERR